MNTLLPINLGRYPDTDAPIGTTHVLFGPGVTRPYVKTEDGCYFLWDDGFQGWIKYEVVNEHHS